MTNTNTDKYKLACQGIGYIFCDIPQFTMIAFDFLEKQLTEFNIDLVSEMGYVLRSDSLKVICVGPTIEKCLLMAVNEVLEGKNETISKT